MPTPLLIAIILIGAITVFASAYETARICNNEYDSMWQTIKYTGNSIEPKYIYVCKRCNNKVDVKHCYCPNCGSCMTNGEARHYYSSEIVLKEDE